MSKWIAQVTVATSAPLGERHLVTLDEAAERWDATVANRAEGPGFTLIIELDELDTIAAARTAMQVLRTVLSEIATGQVVGLRVCTPEQFETEVLRPGFPRWPRLPTPPRSSGCPGSGSTSWLPPTLGSRHPSPG
ncbi:MAG: hypothetical protein ACRDSM_06700 [Pseudonocardiaceae bacterium]